MEKPDFLKQKYNLHNTPEVEQASKRTEIRTGEKIPQKPNEKIQNYLNRFKEIIEREEPSERARGIAALKEVLQDTFVIKRENIPATTFTTEQRIAREMGHGDVEISDEFVDRKTEQIINNQTESLNRWIDYLSSDDAQYPDWAKYWAFRSITEMGKFEKKEDETGREIGRFQNRTKDTVSSFPPLNSRALAMTIRVLRSKLDEKQKPKKERPSVSNRSTKLTDEEFQKLLSTEDFSKLYAQFLLEMPEYSTEGLKEIRGKWVTYEEDSDPTELVNSLEGYPLEWCTADYDTALTQLEGGDFHVYYSLDQKGEAVIPRLAIRMEGDHIAEDPRGIAPNQNLDPYITPVLEEKLKDFGVEADAYKKKSADMKQLTKIDNKIKENPNTEPTKDELTFLYEIDSTIEGFGYEKDPRIAELREGRNTEEDMLTVFECSRDQIAHVPSEITESTKAYVGQLEPGIFDIRPETLEYVYTSFPEKKIKRESVEVGGKSKEQLISEMEASGININSYARSMMDNPDFVVGSSREEAKLVRLTVADLGFKTSATIDQIYERAEALGLELCPPDTGPNYRLKYKDQPLEKSVRIGMRQITDQYGRPSVFCFRLGRYDDGLELLSDHASPDRTWYPDHEFVFRFRPPAERTDTVAV